jgi:hypothetical protein
MLFSINGVLFIEKNILGDDSIRDVALKLTKGQGGVYLFGKCAVHSSAVTVWQKYGRPLSCAELTAELRNIGIKRKVPEKNFEYEDLSDYLPLSEWKYVPLGQSMPNGVRVRPPKQTFSLAEYQDVKCERQPEKRLFDYENLTEVHAVTVRSLPSIYIPHQGGLVPCDSFLKAAVSTWLWNIEHETYLAPVATQCVDLKALFSKVHTTELLPCIAFQDKVRTFANYTCPKYVKDNSITFFFFFPGRSAEITFYENGVVKGVNSESSEMNPVIHYVNQVLLWDSALECDARLLGKSMPFSPLFSDYVYPLCTSTTKERTTIAAKVQAEVPTFSPAWQVAFTPSMHYTRCTPNARVTITENEVRVSNLPLECLPYMTAYLEAWVSASDAQEMQQTDCCITEEVSVEAKTETLKADEYAAYVTKFVKAGYEIGLNYSNGFLAMDLKGRYGFLPCPKMNRTGVKELYSKPWIPTVGYKELKEFLEAASHVDAGVTPRETVYDYKGQRAGVRTKSGAFVPCKTLIAKEKEKEKDDLRKTTEHAILFPKTNVVYGSYCSLVRHVGLDLRQHTVIVDSRSEDFPQWREGKLLLTEKELESFATKLRTDMARFHRLKCYMNGWEQEVEGEKFDVLEKEEVTFL